MVKILFSTYRNTYNEVDQFNMLRIKINSLYDVISKNKETIAETEIYNYLVKLKMSKFKKLIEEFKFQTKNLEKSI